MEASAQLLGTPALFLYGLQSLPPNAHCLPLTTETTFAKGRGGEWQLDLPPPSQLVAACLGSP